MALLQACCFSTFTRIAVVQIPSTFKCPTRPRPLLPESPAVSPGNLLLALAQRPEIECAVS
ncbi:hypothetical protein BD310DRAFT_942088 [Dichomitus squalens]|uniref:Uncharacterized protein n=1 Tax=Dichomitus squalens TaxID=114155 RepID=A0A4Q9PA24_9APHY|nr:hypothetical protein BD310DRAFT_942088 [Dichomitus squalens]